MRTRGLGNPRTGLSCLIAGLGWGAGKSPASVSSFLSWEGLLKPAVSLKNPLGGVWKQRGVPVRSSPASGDTASPPGRLQGVVLPGVRGPTVSGRWLRPESLARLCWCRAL